jgi:hypothetical protein
MDAELQARLEREQEELAGLAVPPLDAERRELEEDEAYRQEQREREAMGALVAVEPDPPAPVENATGTADPVESRERQPKPYVLLERQVIDLEPDEPTSAWFEVGEVKGKTRRSAWAEAEQVFETKKPGAAFQLVPAEHWREIRVVAEEPPPQEPVVRVEGV